MKIQRKTTIISFIAFVVAIAIMSTYDRQSLTKHLITIEEKRKVELAQAFANTLWPDYEPFFEQTASLSIEELRTHVETDKLYQAIALQMMGTDVVKIKLYDFSGRTVFSTEFSQIGDDKSENEGFQSARAGVTASLLSHRDTFNAFENRIADRDIYASYIPIFRQDGSNQVDAVFELYRDVTPLIVDLQKTGIRMGVTITIILGVLFIFLLVQAKRADQVVLAYERERDNSEIALRAARDALEEKVQERTQELRSANSDLRQEISNRKMLEEKLIHDALHDALTGLPNRMLLSDRLEHAIQRAMRNTANNFAVVFLDIDNFKKVNDSFGHDLGDQLLRSVASRIQESVRTIDTVARIGGDEFVLLIEDIGGDHKLSQLLDRLITLLSDPYALEGNLVHVTASLGVTLSTVGYHNAKDVLRDADIAMYRAKANGKGQYAFFNKDRHQAVVSRMTLENDLFNAISQNELQIHYQPVYSLTTDQITGLEALVRWAHPDGTLLYPDAFIPIAEENGLVLDIDLWVLKTACQQVKRWNSALDLPKPLWVSVNLSSMHFAQDTLVSHLVDLLQECDQLTSYISLEVTENMLMANYQEAAGIFSELSEMGIQLSLDDFGTGYSSLSYLHNLPFDYLKIDRSFVNRSNPEHTELPFIRTIADLGHNLGMEVIAEGVETEHDLELVIEGACDFVQGYYFSKPASAETIENLLQEKVQQKSPR